MGKRVFDLTVVGLGALVWLPVVAICAVAILICTGRPIFYHSTRRVFREQSAVIMKFRTMVRDAERVANRATMPVTDQRFLNIPSDSPLYTPVGRMIERGVLTELPQFFHVLGGTMSVVGNRPLPENVIDSLREEFPEVEARFMIRTGMTGPIQLVGRQNVSDADRLAIETEYCHACIAGYSWRLDAIILLKTVLSGLGLVRGMSVADVRALIARHTPVAEREVTEELRPIRRRAAS